LHSSVYTSPIKISQIFLLSALHPIGEPYVAKSEIYWSAKLVGSCPHRSAGQLSWLPSIFTARIVRQADRHHGKLLGLVQDGVTKRIQGARGLVVGGLTLGTHGGLHGPHRKGRSSPQDDGLRLTAQLGAHRKAPRRHPEDCVESDRMC